MTTRHNLKHMVLGFADAALLPTHPTDIPAGFYQKDPGQAAPCPQGEFMTWSQALAANTPSCSRCTARSGCSAGSCDGVTTAGQGSTKEIDCAWLLPTFYAVAISSAGGITTTAKCPRGFFCPGERSSPYLRLRRAPPGCCIPCTPAHACSTTVT